MSKRGFLKGLGIGLSGIVSDNEKRRSQAELEAKAEKERLRKEKLQEKLDKQRQDERVFNSYDRDRVRTLEKISKRMDKETQYKREDERLTRAEQLKLKLEETRQKGLTERAKLKPKKTTKPKTEKVETPIQAMSRLKNHLSSVNVAIKDLEYKEDANSQKQLAELLQKQASLKTELYEVVTKGKIIRSQPKQKIKIDW